jgi:spore maturation protein CgeB
MRILYVGMKFDYGKPERGLSFEHYNFYHALINMGHDIIYFDFMTLLQNHGRQWINKRLIEVVREQKPDLVFSILFGDQFDRSSFKRISDYGSTVTLNWFCDDHWRFESYSRPWADCFNWIVTTSSGAYSKYLELGCRHVIKSQWGCNHFLYRPLNLDPAYDVTFVGQPHGNRRTIVEHLRRKGIKVSTWGNGWEAGRLSQEEMIRVFNRTRINLNLANSYTTMRTAGVRQAAGRIMDKMPFGSTARKAAKKILAHSFPAEPSATARYPEQIKGRNFEVPGCSAFLLTASAENLEEYYTDKEVACFSTTGDLVDRVEHYVRNEDERVRIAQAGYERTIREHTYAHRFSHIFTTMGLPTPPIEKLVAQPVPLGVTEEVE